MSKFYIKKPQLRAGARIQETQDALIVLYDGEEYALLPQEGMSCQSLGFLLHVLDGTRTVEQMKQACQPLTEQQVEECLVALDENWLLSDGHAEPLKGKSGLQFLFHLEDLYRKWELEHGETQLAQLFHDGQAQKEIVMGWALEYYHVTRRAHDCISPAIAKSHGEFREMFVEFFHDEYRHDKLLLKSLTSSGLTEEQVLHSIPLPYTAAVSNLLAKWAHTDLLSYMASLFVFEGTVADGNEYMDSLALYNVADGFRDNQGIHNNINIEGDHGNVSREFYSKIEYITPAEQERVLRNIRLLFEMFQRQNENTIRYYGNPNCQIPRHLKESATKIGY